MHRRARFVARARAARAICTVLAGLGVAASIAEAQAQPRGEDPAGAIARAREFITFAQFREAIGVLEPLLGRHDLTARLRVHALEALAVSFIAVNRNAEARRTIETLLTSDPGHNLNDPDASPRITNFFSKVKREFRPQTLVRLRHERVQDLRTRTGVRVVARVDVGADAIDELRLQYRRQLEGAYARVPMSGDADRSAMVPVLDVDSARYTVEYYVEAVAPSGFVLANVGSANTPLTFSVPSAEESVRRVVAATGPPLVPPAPAPSSGGSVLGSWWFWTAVVLVAAGAGATVYVVQQPPPARDGSFGSGTLE